MSDHYPDSAKKSNHGSPLRGTLAAIGIGGIAQYLLTDGFLLLGLAGYGIATWLFIAHQMRIPEHDPVREDQGIDGKLLQEEINRFVTKTRVIRKNWKQLTLYEIFSRSTKSPIDQDSNQDLVQENESVEVEAIHEVKTLKQQDSAWVKRLKFIKDNWRNMTISEIFSQSADTTNDQGDLQ